MIRAPQWLNRPCNAPMQSNRVSKKPSVKADLAVYSHVVDASGQCMSVSSICDQICQKGSYTSTVSSLTFHGHSTDTKIDQQFMLVPLPKLQRFAFTETSFTGLSGIHGCSSGQADSQQGITTGLAGKTGH